MNTALVTALAGHTPMAPPQRELDSGEWDMLFRAVVARLRLLVPPAPPVVGSLQGSVEDGLQALESLQARRHGAPTAAPLSALLR